MPVAITSVETAKALYEMLMEWLGQHKHELRGAKGLSRTIPKRVQHVTITGAKGAEGAPHPDWYPGKLEELDLLEDIWSRFESGDCWVVPLNGEHLDKDKRYRALCIGTAGYSDGREGESPYRLVYAAGDDGKLWGVLDAQLAAGGSAPMRVRGGAPTLLVYDLLLLVGQTIAAGTTVTVFRDAVDRKYYVDDAQCPGGGGGGGGGGGPCSGLCIWQWLEPGVWVPSSTCSAGCICSWNGVDDSPPNFAGSFFGEEVAGTCIPAP